MAWSQIEATPPHLTYLILSGFLIAYTLFATFIKNRLHLSEPPIALLCGIIVGPRGLGWLNPSLTGVNGGPADSVSDPVIGGWGWGEFETLKFVAMLLTQAGRRRWSRSRDRENDCWYSGIRCRR